MIFSTSLETHQGKVRTINQDNFYCEEDYRKVDCACLSKDYLIKHDDRWLMGIFDGMGGENNGEIASLIAAVVTKEYADKVCDSSDIERLIYTINQLICKEMDNMMTHMGSTVVFLEVISNKCRSWNVGDSRAYLYHAGELVQLSEDHTEAASYSTIITDESSARLGSENRLTQHLGIQEDDFIIEPYVSDWVDIQEYDLMLLCSDGLSHLVNDNEIVEILGRNCSVNEKSAMLLECSLEKGGTDNITIILTEASGR